jgi:hypothetical protein
VEASGSAIHEMDSRGELFVLKTFDRVYPNPFVPHQEIADAENQRLPAWPCVPESVSTRSIAGHCNRFFRADTAGFNGRSSVMFRRIGENNHPRIQCPGRMNFQSKSTFPACEKKFDVAQENRIDDYPISINEVMFDESQDLVGITEYRQVIARLLCLIQDFFHNILFHSLLFFHSTNWNLSMVPR